MNYSNAGQVNRLQSGTAIYKDDVLRFRFDGRSFTGVRGDTLASALLANGVRLVGRSFKYHRPRGIVSAGPEEPNALVGLRSGNRCEPNTKATTIELFDGLEAISQNRWPSLKFDFLSINQLAAPLLVGGFYYKTFMWPAAFWEKVYEPLIRRAAGLGVASRDPDPDEYGTAFAFCDLLVAGSGPAGLMAALSAGRSGARVILCEDDFELGGRLLSERLIIDGISGADFVKQTERELASLPNVQILKRTQVFGSYDSGTFGALEKVGDHYIQPPAGMPRQRLWHIVAKRFVNAMGAIERPIVFGGNDRPGVMLASAVRTYLNRFGVAPGKNVVVFTTSDDGWRTAEDLVFAGINVAAVVEARPSFDARRVAALRAVGCEILFNAQITEARGGVGGVKKVCVRTPQNKIWIDTDCVAVSGGWNPQVGITTHRGSRPKWSESLSAFVPISATEDLISVGAANGEFSLEECLKSGARAGVAVAAACGFKNVVSHTPEVEPDAVAVSPLWSVDGYTGKAFVDLQNDVTANDVKIAHTEGFRAVEHLKRYTTLGMATDQGKTSNINGHAMMASLTGRTIADSGTTVMRPPHAPVAIGAFAGRHRGQHYMPTRVTSTHEWAVSHGAIFAPVGLWLRPQWYARNNEVNWIDSVSREVTTVRTAVGVCDVSTLGKIDIKGRDAGNFLDRIYINTFSTLAIGRARYGVMLREDGFVLDDGTCARFAENHYLMSTTTANAGRVMQHLEFCHQAFWPDLEVGMVSVTEQWAQYSIAGPKSRELLTKLFGDVFDVSDAAIPYMGVTEFEIAGVKIRLFRISFSGELAYEIAVPANYGQTLLDNLLQQGESLGVCVYGTEALGVMRIEKGHVAGNELNGQTTVLDLGLERMASKKKDYIGRTLAQRAALRESVRPSLVGLRPLNKNEKIGGGAHLIKVGAVASTENDEGYVTSAVYSPTVDSWIGLGLLANGQSRLGERMRACDPLRNSDVEVEIVSPVFVDAAGERLRA